MFKYILADEKNGPYLKRITLHILKVKKQTLFARMQIT